MELKDKTDPYFNLWIIIEKSQANIVKLTER